MRTTKTLLSGMLQQVTDQRRAGAACSEDENAFWHASNFAVEQEDAHPYRKDWHGTCPQQCGSGTIFGTLSQPAF